MLSKIMGNFIKNKIFNNTTLKEVKNYYFSKIKGTFFKLFGFSSLGISALIIALNISGFSSVPLYCITFAACFSAIWHVVLFGEYLEEYFSSKVEFEKIEKEIFLVKLININKGKDECFEVLEPQLIAEDFTVIKAEEVMSYMLNSDEINSLMQDFIKEGYSEKEMKEVLKTQISRKNEFRVTVGDFYLMQHEIKKREYLQEKEKNKDQVGNILDNMIKKEVRKFSLISGSKTERNEIKMKENFLV